MTVIQQELQRGCDITDNIILGKAPWCDLFVKHTFFTQGYKYYISVITASTDKEAHKIWSGYVESKVRVLVQGLEQHQSIALAHAFNKGYDRRHRCANDEEVQQVQAGNLSFLVSVENDHSAATATMATGGQIEEKVDLSGIPGLKAEVDGKPHSKTEGARNVGGEVAEPGMSPPKKLEGEQQEAKPAKDGQQTPIDVFTTTHYIGLTLSEGR